MSSALLTAVLLASPASADETARASKYADRGTLGLTFENDSFADTDRHYTSGATLSWFSRAGAAPAGLARVLTSTPLLTAGGDARVSVRLGHNMFTPEAITTDRFLGDDRPYAGWFYGTAGLLTDTGGRLDHLELTVGMLGPSAMGEEVQTKVHVWSDSRLPEGWEHQLANEPGAALTWRRLWRLPPGTGSTGWGAEALPHVGGSVGNVYTNATAGVSLRLGRDLAADYGPQGVRPVMSGAGFFKPTRAVGGYAFAGVEGSAVARNIFLDGNTFQESHSVDKHNLLGAAEVGLTLTVLGTRLSYTHVLRTPEFRGQQGVDDWGSVSISASL